MEKREPFYTVGGNANQYSHYGQQCGDSFKNWKQNCFAAVAAAKLLHSCPTLCDPIDSSPSGSPIPGHTLKEIRIERDTCTPMLIAALFTTARTQKQPRCPLADTWIRKLWYMYTIKCYSALKQNTFESVLMRWMKLEPIIQSEVSQKEKHQYSILTHIYGIQKDGNDNPVCETAKETQMYKTVFWTLWERERVG